jgi:ABC-type polysaccharide/polyol phosphate transport system ATPase subunit
MNALPALELEEVGLEYRLRRRFRVSQRNVVFRGVNLSLLPGEKLGITGANGMGKSSLLMLLAGTLAPTNGRIVNRCGTTALLAMNLGMEPRLSGRINAIMHALYLGFRREQIERLIPEIARFAGLEEVLDNPFYTYSSGMRARLSFSVACHLQADLILIDEMLSTGDQEFREKSRHAMRELLKATTAVVVSHNLQLLKNLCDRTLFLDRNGLHPT